MADIEDTIKKLEALEKVKLEALNKDKDKSICPHCNKQTLISETISVAGQQGFKYKCLNCKYTMSTH